MLIPPGFAEREPSPRSMRWPKDIAKKVEEVAGATHHDFSTTVFHLLQWALAEYDRQRAEEKSGKVA